MDTPILEGQCVRLEPLTLAHLPALEAIAFDPTVWRYMIYPMRGPEDLRAWTVAALELQAAGTTLPWVTIQKAHNGQPDTVVGATRFIDFNRYHRSVEIGNTWLGEPWRGTRVNTEVKLLQLTYAFETLDLLRVAFKTHSANKRSQSAIKALGAHYEGTFRSHYVMPDGSSRDSAWYSIIRTDWPEVKDLLTRRLNAPQ